MNAYTMCVELKNSVRDFEAKFIDQHKRKVSP